MNDITVKELYERVLSLETKVDLLSKTGKNTRDYFRNLAILILFLSGLNLVVHSILVLIQLR